MTVQELMRRLGELREEGYLHDDMPVIVVASGRANCERPTFFNPLRRVEFRDPPRDEGLSTGHVTPDGEWLSDDLVDKFPFCISLDGRDPTID